jgi:hypothetical protein
MKIHRQNVDGSVERKLLTGMIVSTEFMEGVITFYDPDLVETRFVRTVMEWCTRYFKQYVKAPGIHIKDIFESHAGRMDSTEREYISDLLNSLSDEYARADKVNVHYLLDQAEAYFKTRSLSQLSREISGHLLEGEVQEAESLLGGYKRVGRPLSLGENPFTSADAISRAFEHEETPLFTLPGPLGKMLNRELKRDQFLAIMGPEKRGKTWWLNEIALRAAKARCNVALFQVGDMSEDQVTLRLSVRLAGKSNVPHYCQAHASPVPDCMLNQLGRCQKGNRRKALGVEIKRNELKGLYLSGNHNSHKSCTECISDRDFRGSLWYQKVPEVKPLTWREAWKTGCCFLGRIKGRDFRLSVHAADVLTVSGIKGILDNWETFEDFIPDVVVIDYADNLAPEDRREEYRHQQNRTWKLLRGLSQERHCLVVTATQASARAYGKELIDMSDYSEDKRKYAHVTAMIGLNQTQDEKSVGILRINMIVQREGEFFSERTVKIAQDLWVGKPLLFSF